MSEAITSPAGQIGLAYAVPEPRAGATVLIVSGLKNLYRILRAGA